MSNKFLYKKSEENSESNLTPGVGADIFIRKKEPGAKVGKGYIVDIYESGVKVDTHEVKTKSDYTDIIRQFKEKYNTDRAFQNELQVHITFKTKEERGEVPVSNKDTDTNSVPKEQNENTNVTEEMGKKSPLEKKVQEVPEEGTMASIDKALLKQAYDINNLLQRLVNPEFPIKLRHSEFETTPIPDAVPQPEGAQQEVGGINSVPDTAAPGGSEDKEAIKRQIVSEIVNKFTSFVKEKVDAARAMGVAVAEISKDELYNPLKSWYGKLAEEISKWNQISNDALNMQDVQDMTTESSKILKSKDLNLLNQQMTMAFDSSSKKQASQIDEEVANLIAEIAGMGIATQEETDSGGDLGGDPNELSNEVNKEGKDQNDERTANENVVEFAKQIHMQGHDAPIDMIAKDLNIIDKSNLMAMLTILDKRSSLNESETTAKYWIKEELDSKKFIESNVKDFWRYAENVKGTHDVEDTFLDWVDGKELKVAEVQACWNKVSNDVYEILLKIASVFLGSDRIISAFNLFISTLTSFIQTNPNIQDPRYALDDMSVQAMIEESLLDYLSANTAAHVPRVLANSNVGSQEIMNEVMGSLEAQRNDHINVISTIIGEQLVTQGLNENIVKSIMVELPKYLNTYWDSIVNSGKLTPIVQDIITQHTTTEPAQQNVAEPTQQMATM